MKNKKIIRNSKVIIKLKETEQVNPLHHKNIHFQKEYEREKKLFFVREGRL